MATKLIFIRHGQTDWNAKMIYCGSSDVCLSQKGKTQARKLKKVFRGQQIDKIYCSNKKRALETAKIIFGKEKIVELEDLREMHFGVFEGLSYEQIQQKYPKVYKKWLHEPFTVTIPKGENLKDFKKRILRAVRKIMRAEKDKTVAVVCHGGVIGIFLSHLNKTKDFWKYVPSSASVTIINISHL
ncbi:MAG: histidine phosphatase family protein [Candidatus Omnitrophica bacterium]|nr:histidine phosphatase family protein [Candidatus Omnitrophota bacterium]MDD5653908.1 histidine phosphatase family protein [Candidatus Omnitrophota bacterium]